MSKAIESHIYLVSTTDGVNFSAPYEVASSFSVNGNHPLDHAWLVIDQTDNSKYVLWTNDNTDDSMLNPTLHFTKYGSGVVGTLDQVQFPFSPNFGTLAIGAGRHVYAAWAQVNNFTVTFSLQFCEVNTTTFGCTNGLGGATVPMPITIEPQGGPNDQPAGTILNIRQFGPWSLAASQRTPGRLFLATQHQNAAGYMQVYLSVSNDYGATWTQPTYPVYHSSCGSACDSTDQAMPTVSVTQNDVVFVGWYRLQRCNCVDPCSHTCFEGRYVMSLDQGATFLPDVSVNERVGLIGNLPVHCVDNTNYLGDFHDVFGSGYHTHVSANTGDTCSQSSPACSAIWQTFVTPHDSTYP
jgi:hypothetical protein